MSEQGNTEQDILIEEIDITREWLENSSIIINNTLGVLSLDHKFNELGLSNDAGFKNRCEEIISNILTQYEEYLGLR